MSNNEPMVTSAPRKPGRDPIQIAIWMFAVIIGLLSLSSPQGAEEPGLARSLSTVWVTLLLLWATYAFAPSRRGNALTWRRWRAAWTAALVLFCIHGIVSIAGPLGGDILAMFDSPQVSTPFINLALLGWWIFDVALAWLRPRTEESSPAWIRRQRAALHVVILIPWLIATVVLGTPTGQLIGLALALIAASAWILRKARRPAIYATTATIVIALAALLAFPTSREEVRSLAACARLAKGGFRPVAQQRADRFLGKVREVTARCRGGSFAVEQLSMPWVDWSNYWGTGDSGSRYLPWSPLGAFSPSSRGVDGALLDLEYQRIELIRLNLFENSGTFRDYALGRDDVAGRSLRTWPEMRLEADHDAYQAVGGDGEQLCRGELIRFRTTTGICNDIRNPAMGSTEMLFARNTPFEEAFPERGLTELTRNRHADRIGILRPDPQTLSRRLLTRQQSDPETCGEGFGAENPSATRCDYLAAPFFNVLAAFWIQFMTHDWFSHLDEGHNSGKPMPLGCEDEQLGCRPDDRFDRTLIADDSPPPTFDAQGEQRWIWAPGTTRNNVTAWWDASQIYGYDQQSIRRVKQDPADQARLLLLPASGTQGVEAVLGTLPLFDAGDPIDAQWVGQEATGFPDNWSIGLSFLHNVFAREHNLFVDAFRTRASAAPDEDSGLRDPDKPTRAIRNQDVSDELLFQVARLVVSAEIAKIHTIEWTTQLLYDEPLYRGMNANWSGILHDDLLSYATERIALRFAATEGEAATTKWWSVFASGSGIFGLGNRKVDLSGNDTWDVSNPDHVNAGVNHFGSPFNFPEEFTTVYRLHPLLPDVLEIRDVAEPNRISRRLPVVNTFRGAASKIAREIGMPNLAMSMGRQRLGALTLQNHPMFLQNLPMPVERTGTGKLDVVALDLIRDRERGLPRFNEFRRQYGLQALTTFDDFIDQRLPVDSPARAHQVQLAEDLRELYGQHRCDDEKLITAVQRLNGREITDCLGHPDGTVVDNVEDVDVVVGFLAESTRPHGYAISETQFHVFILNAS